MNNKIVLFYNLYKLPTIQHFTSRGRNTATLVFVVTVLQARNKVNLRSTDHL